MPNLTDLIIFIVFVIYGITGWKNGALKSILGPASFVLCFILAWQYFKQTHNVLISFSISFLGPIVINGFGSWMLSLQDHVEGVPPKPPSETSRLTGVLINLTWGVFVLCLFMVFMGMGLIKQGPLGTIRMDVVKSRTYAFLAPQLRPILPVELPGEIKEDDGTLAETPAIKPAVPPQRAEDQAEFQALMSDPRIKDISTDPEVAEMIQNRDFARLAQNEKFARILDDPQLILRMLQMQSKINALPPQ